ncbi:MAG TPA: hypothetical protein VGD38_16225, partial [Pyrinomonadaceae bacterium]
MRRVFAVSIVICGLIVAGAMSQAGQANQDRPRNTQPAASPSPTPQTQRPTGPPTLGEPPPVPRLKPTPTPTPPDVIEAGDTIKINAELVQLHVRVIDRNNRPINDVPQNAFHVFEDGIAQAIETFSREEVPISYGLAVDTSGSLRS